MIKCINSFSREFLIQKASERNRIIKSKALRELISPPRQQTSLTVDMYVCGTISFMPHVCFNIADILYLFLFIPFSRCNSCWSTLNEGNDSRWGLTKLNMKKRTNRKFYRLHISRPKVHF